jgi:16S rRNA (guanine527-N7)-methyltransferase
MATLFEATLLTALDEWGLPILPRQLEQLRAHHDAVVDANRYMNLTRIVDPAQAAIKHYADSLALWLWADERGISPETVLDIGTGAGFPAVPLAVLRPACTVTAIDATRKKAEFVLRTAAAMGLANLRVEHAHSRHWHPKRAFQIVTLRAVVRMAEAVGLAATHVVPGGWIVSYQTASAGGVDVSKSADGGALAAAADLQAEKAHPYALQDGEQTLRRVLRVFRRGPATYPSR